MATSREGPRFALVAFPAAPGQGRPTVIAVTEDALAYVQDCGWIVLARDTGVYDDRLLRALAQLEIPMQSNPRRRIFDGDDRLE